MKYWLGQNGYWPAPATLAQHLTDIGSVSACNRGQCFVFTGLNAAQPTRGIEPVLVWCWVSVADGGPALDQHSVNVVFAGSLDKCFASKRNKFRLIHRLYCPQEPFNNISYKSHWHYIYQLSTFLVMLLEGKHLQFFVHKKLDPSSLFYFDVYLTTHV